MPMGVHWLICAEYTVRDCFFIAISVSDSSFYSPTEMMTLPKKCIQYVSMLTWLTSFMLLCCWACRACAQESFSGWDHALLRLLLAKLHDLTPSITIQSEYNNLITFKNFLNLVNQILIIQRIFSILQPLHFIDFVLGKCFSGQCASSFRYAGIAPQRSPGVWDWVQTIKPGIVSKKKNWKEISSPWIKWCESASCGQK